jgi:hypothetical protein
MAKQPLKRSVKAGRYIPVTFSTKEIQAIDSWILSHKRKVDRPQAIRHLVKLALALGKLTNQMGKNRAPLGAELMALRVNLIQNPGDFSTPKVERLTPKRE